MKLRFIIISLLIILTSCNNEEIVDYDYIVGPIKIDLKLNENMVQFSGSELDSLSKTEKNFNKKILLSQLSSSYKKENQAIIVDTTQVFSYLSIQLDSKAKITNKKTDYLRDNLVKQLEGLYTVSEIENKFLDQNRNQYKLKFKLEMKVNTKDNFFLTVYLINVNQVAFYVSVGSENENDFEESLKMLKNI